jgi:hypothetical protein
VIDRGGRVAHGSPRCVGEREFLSQARATLAQMADSLTPDHRAGRVAARHHGLLRYEQVCRCGLTDRQIYRRVRSGRWTRLAPGVFRVTGAPVTPAQVAYAAVIASADGALVGGLTALALLGVGPAPLVPHLTVPPSSGGRTRNAIVRRSPVHALDRTRIGPIPCVSPGRAIVEAAALVDAEVLSDLVADVLCRRLCPTSSVIGALRRAPTGKGRQGSTVVRSALDPWLHGIRPGSPAELRLLRRLADWGFPAPVLQHEVSLPGNRRAFLDIAWPTQHVGLEYDGERAHTPAHLAADVPREERLRTLRWWIGRVDRDDLRPSSTRLRHEVLPRLRLAA